MKTFKVTYKRQDGNTGSTIITASNNQEAFNTWAEIVGAESILNVEFVKINL